MGTPCPSTTYRQRSYCERRGRTQSQRPSSPEYALPRVSSRGPRLELPAVGGHRRGSALALQSAFRCEDACSYSAARSWKQIPPKTRRYPHVSHACLPRLGAAGAGEEMWCCTPALQMLVFACSPAEVPKSAREDDPV